MLSVINATLATSSDESLYLIFFLSYEIQIWEMHIEIIRFRYKYISVGKLIIFNDVGEDALGLFSPFRNE